MNHYKVKYTYEEGAYLFNGTHDVFARTAFDAVRKTTDFVGAPMSLVIVAVYEKGTGGAWVRVDWRSA